MLGPKVKSYVVQMPAVSLKPCTTVLDTLPRAKMELWRRQMHLLSCSSQRAHTAIPNPVTARCSLHYSCSRGDTPLVAAAAHKHQHQHNSIHTLSLTTASLKASAAQQNPAGSDGRPYTLMRPKHAPASAAGSTTTTLSASTIPPPAPAVPALACTGMTARPLDV